MEGEERERERRERESAERERERGREVERESGGNLKTCKKKKVVSRSLSFFFFFKAESVFFCMLQTAVGGAGLAHLSPSLSLENNRKLEKLPRRLSSLPLSLRASQFIKKVEERFRACLSEGSGRSSSMMYNRLVYSL